MSREMKKLNIVVAMPERQHSFKLITALRNNGFETTYLTTVYFKKKSLLLRLIKGIMPQGVYFKAKKHYCEGIEDSNVIIMLPILALVQLASLKVSVQLYDAIRHIKSYLFSIKVTSYLKKHKPDVLILYEDYSSNIIKRIHNSSTKIIIDCSAASKTLMKKVYENDDEGRHIKEFKKEYPELWTKAEDIEQFRRADCLLVPSEFSRSSYLEVGVPDSKIHVLCYPLSIKKSAIKKEKKHDGLIFVYSGQITYRKGLHHLLEAFCYITERYNAELFLYGAYEKNNSLYSNYGHIKNIHFTGWVMREKMLEQMQKADVFIFPSLADSMSFSCLEAMSIGLPVICTSSTGASDLIDNYCSGIIVSPASTDAIKDAIIWCFNNQEKLVDMGNRASKKVSTLADDKRYREELQKIVLDVAK